MTTYVAPVVTRAGAEVRELGCVLFDFSETLFRPMLVPDWVKLASASDRLLSRNLDCLTRGLKDALDTQVQVDGYQQRDESPEFHRSFYESIFTNLTNSTESARALYDVMESEEFYASYDDTEEVVRSLRSSGLRLAVVSNFPWSVERYLSASNLESYFDDVVTSCDVGVRKPNPALFELACERVGVATNAAVMVGDDPLTDGGAVSAGIPVVLLPRPRAHASVRGLHILDQLIGGN